MGENHRFYFPIGAELEQTAFDDCVEMHGTKNSGWHARADTELACTIHLYSFILITEAQSINSGTIHVCVSIAFCALFISCMNCWAWQKMHREKMFPPTTLFSPHSP
eukprot:m.109641 g.109641  ORF g.109641 m.109641 type:complete len:107 (-) comp9204_c1_seq1:1785-2105(-)